MRVLIVDDEAPARAHLRTLLQEVEGVELVGEASTAAEAETLLRAVEHDLVFLDIRMPGMDGIEAASLFAELPKPPFVVFTTAYEEYAAKAFELGAADYLLKPISRAAAAEGPRIGPWSGRLGEGAARRAEVAPAPRRTRR